jgi:hypothetical protein
VRAGLCVTSHNSSAIATGVFSSVSFVPDTTPPAVTSADYLFDTSPNTLSYSFSEDVSASLSSGDLSVTGPGGAVGVSGVTWGGNNTASFMLAQPLTSGDYQATLSGAGVMDRSNNSLAGGNFQLSFFILPGDANRDRSVDTTDFNILAANFGLSGTNFSGGDFNYDGLVDTIDFNILAANFASSLPAPAPAARAEQTPAPAPSFAAQNIFSELSLSSNDRVAAARVDPLDSLM